MVNLQGQERNYQSLIGKTYGERQPFLFHHFYADDELRSDSIRYFNEVSKLLNLAEKNHDKELILECEFLKYNYLSSKNYKNYLPEMKAFLAKVDKSEIIQLQARTRQAIGLHYYYEKDDYKKAYIYLKESYSYIKKLNIKELPDKQELLYNIGFVNYNIGYDFKALEFLKEAEKLDNNYYPTLECNILNTEGLIHQREGNWEKALTNYQKTFELGRKINNATWIRVAKNNIARIFINQKKYPEAKELLKDFSEIDSIPAFEAGPIKARQLMLCGKIFVAENNWEALPELIENLKSLNREFKLPLNLKRDIYKLISMDSGHRGNFADAYFYSDSALEFATKYYRLKNDEGLKQAIEKERIESVEQEQLKASHQKILNDRTWILMFVILILIFILSAVLLKRQQKTYIRQKQEVESELHGAKEKLSELVSDLKSRNKELEAYEEELEKLYHNGKESQLTERKKTLEELLSKPIMTDAKWIVFKREFDKAHPEYHDELLTAIPSISPAEIRYMYLRKLRLSSKEISFILGISQGTIRQYKHRIKNKIGKECHVNFDEFLDNI